MVAFYLHVENMLARLENRRIAPARVDAPPFGEPSRPKEKNQGRKKRRPGTNAIREIKKLQASTDFLIPKLPFARVVKDLCVRHPSVNK
jgi:hypothetical protein